MNKIIATMRGVGVAIAFLSVTAVMRKAGSTLRLGSRMSSITRWTLSMSDAAHALRDHRPGDAQAAAAQTLTRLEEGRRQTANGLRRSLGLDQDGLPRDPLGRVLAVDGDSVAVQIPADGDMAAAQAVLAALRQTHTPPPPRPLSLSERLLRLLRDRI